MKFHLFPAGHIALVMCVVLCPQWARAAEGDSPPALTPEPKRSLISAEHEAFFESKIRPLLIEHCYECHSTKSGESSGDLLLDTASGMIAGGASGASLVPGKPDASLLIKAVRYADPDYEMPPTGKLDSGQIDLLEQWVKMGAPDPRRSESDPSKAGSPMDIDPASHWAFNAPRRYSDDVPLGEGDRDRIDGIARAIASRSGVNISPRCDDGQLVRRLYHDLTGIPPTDEQVDVFVSSQREDKLERLVDQLLVSPEFGERFARHWMDVARYADTVGYALAGKERRLKGSERYRDWLIRAFATDLPFDEMVRLQLSADRIDPDNADGNLDAMGFLTVGRRFLSGFDTTDDRIDVITRGLMGMTVTCARCHDHKFDPIPTQDYYSLLGILQSCEVPKEGASPLMMVDKAKPRDSRVFLRGQPGNPGEVAPRQYLTALREPNEAPFSDGSGRYELALKLSSEENPLVSRVFVNRIWMHLIGRPIIESTSDFGVRTEASPLVPVLDELSADLVRHWSTKRLIRRIVTSRIYAQSSIPADADSLQRDAENLLAARGNRKRRDFESMRDSTLSVCGQLDHQVGGEPTEIHLNSISPRRTIYAMIDRQNLPSLFRTFDFASPDAHAPKRFMTTVPQQALFLMNHPQVGALAQKVVKLERARVGDQRTQIEGLFARILSRKPTESELRDCERFVSVAPRDREVEFDPRVAWKYGTSPVGPESRAEPFQPLATFSGSSWQDQAKLPATSELGYASLGQENGHPGRKHAVVKRWIAPADGIATIRGMVGHRSGEGDGVELALWVGGKRIWRTDQKSNNRPFSRLSGRVKAGQTVDFVIGPRKTDSFDSFFLRAHISLRTAAGAFFEGDSVADFAGPVDVQAAEPLDRMEQLAQTLMLSNEFLFID